MIFSVFLSFSFVTTIIVHQVSGTTLTITPSQVEIGGANPTALNGTRSPPAGIQAIYTIYIGRKRLLSGVETSVVEIALGVDNDQPVIKDGSLRSRLNVQGDIKNNPKSLSFSLKDPTCDDIKDYTFYCKTQFLPDSAGNREDFKNVTYRVNPGDVRMTVFPQYENYFPGTLVTFTCVALIGSSFPSDQSNFWTWEWRDVSQIIPTSWTRYPNSANITYGTPTSAANCNYNGRSELRHTVKEFDYGRQFRCYIVNSALYSANITIRIEATTPAIQTGPTAPSTGTQERNDLDCSGGRMRIHVPQTLLPTHIVTLRDPSCKVASNGSHLLADVGVNECGTTVSFTNDSVIFTNELVATALSGTTAPTIIDYGMNMKDQRVKISCIYPRENRIDFSYVPVMKEAHFYERQYGKLSFDVSQYSDEQFSHAIPHNGLPIGVTLNTELFIDISLRHASHKGVGIMVDSCIATPTSSPADPLWYTVIKDGCPAQQDVRTFASPDVDEFRFSFLVFRFTQAPLQKAGPNLPPTSMVFIHCQVSACPSQNCTNTCNPAGSHRVRREAELENSHLVSAGPFYLKSEEERGGYTGGVVAASVSMAVVATLVAIVALVAWRRSVNKLSKHQTLDEAS